MNWLQPNFYVCFPVTSSDYNILLLDLMSYSRLALNAHFVRTLKPLSSKASSGNEIIPYLRLLRDFKPSTFKFKNIDEKLLQDLHLNVQRDERVMTPEPEELNSLFLITEKFFCKHPSLNLGSARHALLYNYQIKGIGKNPLAIRTDHAHSWGGIYLWQSVKAYIIGHLLQGIAPLGVLNSTMVSVKNTQGKNSDMSLLFRESHATRVTQVMTQFDPHMNITKKSIVDAFIKRVGVKTAEEHMDKIIFHYSVLYLMGVRHLAINRENISLEGPLLDYEDVKWDVTPEAFKFYLVFQKCLKKQKPYQFYKGERLHTSVIHFYFDAIELTALGLSELTPYQFTRKKLLTKMQKMMKLLGQEVFDIDPAFMKFSNLLLEHSPIYTKGVKVDSLQGDDTKLIRNFMKDHPVQNTLQEDHTVHEHSHFEVSLPRPKFKAAFLEEINQGRFVDITELASEVMKHIQVESRLGAIDFKAALELSSACNKVIGKNVGCFPFELRKGKIVPVYKKRQKLLDELKEKTQELGAKVIRLDEITDPLTKTSYVRGAFLSVNSTDHYVLIKPTLMK